METKAIINKIIPFSNVDGPGNRLAIFFQGCNINCVYCHNHETINKCINCMECISVCPTKAIKDENGKISFDEKLCSECDACIKRCPYNSSPRTKEYSIKELLSVIEEYKPFIRGITVSGGEPTINAKFIAELFIEVKALGLTCFVDTNGFFDKSQIAELIEVTDKFMVDIKAVSNIEKLCNSELKNNLENLIYLLKRDKVYEVRTVIVKDYLDIENTIETVANILKDYPDVIYKLIRMHITGLSEKQKEALNNKIPEIELIKGLEARIRNIGVKKVELIL